MKAQIAKAAVLVIMIVLTAGAQAAPGGQAPAAAPAATKPAGQQQSEEGVDRFPQARASADEALEAYEKVYAENVREVERLLKSRRCQIARISGLLDRTSASLEAWLSAENYYWTSWNEAETKRVESQQKSLASLEADQNRAKDLVAADKQDREELMRRKALLETSPRTAQITADIDGLIKDLQDSEARLSDAQKQFEDITSSINNLKASLTARLVNIRQNIAQLDTYRLEQHAAYEDKRKTAQEICNTKQPDTKKSPLPKRSSGSQ